MKQWLLAAAVVAVAIFGLYKFSKHDSCVKGVVYNLSSNIEMHEKLTFARDMCNKWGY